MKGMMALLAQRQGARAGIRCEASGSTATIWIYDVIGGWSGILAADVARVLAGLQADTLDVRINCPGGDVFEARAIKTALDGFPGKVVAHVDGLAASAASFLMLASDEIRISRGAFVMIHNPWGFAVGDAGEMRKTADLLDQVTATLVRDYTDATGKSAEQIAQWMADETWFDADAAVANGFAHAIVEGRNAPENAAAWDIAAAYAKAPKAAVDAAARAAPKGEPEKPAVPEQPAPAAVSDVDDSTRARERARARLTMYERI